MGEGIEARNGCFLWETFARDRMGGWWPKLRIQVIVRSHTLIELTRNVSTSNKVLSIRHEAPHTGMTAHPTGVRVLPHSLRHTSLSQLLSAPTMDPNRHRQKRRDRALPLLNAAIKAMDLAKEASSGTPAAAAFGSVSILLTTIRVRFSLFPTI